MQDELASVEKTTNGTIPHILHWNVLNAMFCHLLHCCAVEAVFPISEEILEVI
jgi:hypothetical protein